MIKPDTIWGPHFYCPQPIELPVKNSIAYKALTLAAVLDNSKPEYSACSSLKIVRAILAFMLASSSNIHDFDSYSQNHRWGRVQKKDQQETHSWLSWYASVTGLLHIQEIIKLSSSIGGYVPAYINKIDDEVQLDSLEGVINRSKQWTSTGYQIGAFQGAFDHPTSTHLSNATAAHLWAQRHGVKMKLIWWFDKDSLIKRKGNDRPRFDLVDRRKSVEGLWQVGTTAISTATATSDHDSYLNDYESTGTKFVFVTDDEDLAPERISTAIQSGAQIVSLNSSLIDQHSSDKIWKFE